MAEREEGRSLDIRRGSSLGMLDTGVTESF